MFMLSSFRSVYANCSSKENRARLKTLCTLAVEGMWKRVFVFNSEDLRRNRICESEQTVWLQVNFLNTRGDCFVFYNPALQWYFAALFYFLREDKDKPHPIIGSLPQLLKEIYACGETQWSMTGIFVFGIATEIVAAMLKPHFGFIPSKEVRQEILKCFRSLGQGDCSGKLSPQRLFDGLLDSQEEPFETQVLDLFEEMTIDISSTDELSLAKIYLLKSQKLKKLHLHIQHRIFSEIYNPEEGDLEEFTQEKTCSFMTNFGNGALFPTLLRLPHLKSLNLYGTNLSSDVVENMCSVLKCPTCRVEELLLGNCDISSEACGVIATSLTKCKVKHLSLVENPLKNEGVMLLCQILKHPSCVLKTLMLSYCCLTFIACGHLYEALLCNRSLSLLDLGSNFLEDTGVNILCEALKDPTCCLQELWLDMCEFTTGSCADLALALTKCKTLTSLNLDWMTFDPDGLELLCEALNHKACNLKVLGLDKSASSKESQMLLEGVEKKNLIILHYPWINEERKKRGVCLVWNSKN
ncbi:NACHT, LRR and PYD domains-containing protein 9A [Cricetulus griseus]|uniref:NACHT, LRR and PYD domains-containing protein 9A n=1 Tax=Cricetulus griseus TaxID=10029 RepID=G3HWB6_CRIGR|nr:NACHT, LRR and PYD domains-containing protein 9A [Cricetulus griseus]